MKLNGENLDIYTKDEEKEIHQIGKYYNIKIQRE